MRFYQNIFCWTFLGRLSLTICRCSFVDYCICIVLFANALYPIPSMRLWFVNVASPWYHHNIYLEPFLWYCLFPIFHHYYELKWRYGLHKSSLRFVYKRRNQIPDNWNIFQFLSFLCPTSICKIWHTRNRMMHLNPKKWLPLVWKNCTYIYFTCTYYYLQHSNFYLWNWYCGICNKENGYTFRGDNSVKVIFASILKRGRY